MTIEVQRTFQINSGNYRSDIKVLATDLHFMERVQCVERANTQIETFGNNWILAWTHLEGEQVGIRSGNSLVSMTGEFAIFIPPFSIMEWHLKSGMLRWNALVSGSALPDFIPLQPFMFRCRFERLPTSIVEVFSLLEDTVKKKKIIQVIEEQRKSSILAQRTKKYICDHYKDDLKITDLADIFGASRVVITRSFQQSYGMPPVEYRHRVRIFEAMRQMNSGKDVTTALFESGFSDPAQFIGHFKKFMSAKPIQYCPVRALGVGSRHARFGSSSTVARISKQDPSSCI